MRRFTNKVAKEIALISFGHMLDCLLGYSDDNYSFVDSVDEHEQNIEDDLKEAGFVVTTHKVELVKSAYLKLKDSFEAAVRKRYYKPKN